MEQYSGVCVVAAIVLMVLLAQRVLKSPETAANADLKSEARTRLRNWHAALFAMPLTVVGLLQLLLLGTVLSLGFVAHSQTNSQTNSTTLYRNLEGALLLSAGVACLCVCLAFVSALARHLRDQGTSKNVTIGPVGQEVRATRFSISDALMLVPLIVPATVLAIASAGLQGRVFHFYGSPLSVVVLHCFAFLPLAYFVLVAGLGQFPVHSLQLAKNLRVGTQQYCVRVFARSLIKHSILAWFLVFCVSLNDSSLARYVGGDFQTFAISIANSQISELTPAHYRLIALLFVGTLCVFGALSAAVFASDKKKSQYLRKRLNAHRAA